MVNRGFKAHLRAAFTAALLLGLWQIVIETLLIALRFRGFLVSPHEFARTQMYDYCVKLFVVLPGGAHWLQQGALDRFLGDGFAAKLVVAGGVLVPNLVVGALLAVAVGALLSLRRRPASVGVALTVLLGLALTVHLVSYAATVHVPKAWTVHILLRNSAWVLLRDGTWIALATLVLAGGCATAMVRLRPGGRLAVSAGSAAAAAAIVFVLLPAGSSPAAAPVPAPLAVPAAGAVPHVDNVVLISIDSLRADHLGCYGNPHDTSPAIDRVARDGVRFANAMSATSWTLPSHMSLLTGRYLLSHGVISQNDQLPPGVPTLAEMLRRAGLSTGGVVSALWLQPRYGFQRGFDYYDDSSVQGKAWYEELSLEPAPNVTDHALAWLRQQHGRFFLFVHFWDVHYDYAPPAPYDKMFDPDYKGTVTGTNFMHNKAIRRGMPQRDLQHVLALYDGEIRWVDDHVAKILAALDDMGVSDRTAVIVTADHGDEFFEHGGKGHQRTLYREVVHVPLIMRVPGITGGRVVPDPVSLVDVMPTALELAGAQTPAGVDGKTLVPALLDGSASDRGAIYGWLCNPERRTDCEAMKESPADTLIHVFQPPRVELYGAEDRAERKNLARGTEWGRHKRLTALGEALNARWKVYRGLEGRRGSVKIDQATKERLRALGYAD